MVSNFLIELTNDPDELQNISHIYTQQDFRVIEISKSVSNYNAPPLKCLREDDEQFLIPSDSTKQKSKYGYENQISLVSPFLKHRQKPHIFQLMNVEKLQKTQN